MKPKTVNKNRKILAVDDDPASLLILKKSLELEGYKVETASEGREALGKISEFGPHLVLMDVNMPGLNGIETLSLLRSQQEYVSTIFVSAQNDHEDIIKGLDSGADDYICKPLHVPELLSRIRTHLRIKDIRDELARANIKLQELVDQDDLTGLYNMRALYKKLQFELERAIRYKTPIAVVMMDMDHFKTVNDENDHLFGSFVLTRVGNLITENIRKVDFAARYGGDEFLIVLTQASIDGAMVFCERLRKAIEGYTFKNDIHEKKLTVSIGFAISGEKMQGLEARGLVRHADRALYSAKSKGRNRIEYYQYDSQS